MKVTTSMDEDGITASVWTDNNVYGMDNLFTTDEWLG